MTKRKQVCDGILSPASFTEMGKNDSLKSGGFLESSAVSHSSAYLANQRGRASESRILSCGSLINIGNNLHLKTNAASQGPRNDIIEGETIAHHSVTGIRDENPDGDFDYFCPASFDKHFVATAFTRRGNKIDVTFFDSLDPSFNKKEIDKYKKSIQQKIIDPFNSFTGDVKRIYKAITPQETGKSPFPDWQYRCYVQKLWTKIDALPDADKLKVYNRLSKKIKIVSQGVLFASAESLGGSITQYEEGNIKRAIGSIKDSDIPSLMGNFDDDDNAIDQGISAFRRGDTDTDNATKYLNGLVEFLNTKYTPTLSKINNNSSLEDKNACLMCVVERLKHLSSAQTTPFLATDDNLKTIGTNKNEVVLGEIKTITIQNPVKNEGNANSQAVQPWLKTGGLDKEGNEIYANRNTCGLWAAKFCDKMQYRADELRQTATVNDLKKACDDVVAVTIECGEKIAFSGSVDAYVNEHERMRFAYDNETYPNYTKYYSEQRIERDALWKKRRESWVQEEYTARYCIEQLSKDDEGNSVELMHAAMLLHDMEPTKVEKCLYTIFSQPKEGDIVKILQLLSKNLFLKLQKTLTYPIPDEALINSRITDLKKVMSLSSDPPPNAETLKDSLNIILDSRKFLYENQEKIKIAIAKEAQKLEQGQIEAENKKKAAEKLITDTFTTNDQSMAYAKNMSEIFALCADNSEMRAKVISAVQDCKNATAILALLENKELVSSCFSTNYTQGKLVDTIAKNISDNLISNQATKAFYCTLPPSLQEYFYIKVAKYNQELTKEHFGILNNLLSVVIAFNSTKELNYFLNGSLFAKKPSDEDIFKLALLHGNQNIAIAYLDKQSPETLNGKHQDGYSIFHNSIRLLQFRLFDALLKRDNIDIYTASSFQSSTIYSAIIRSGNDRSGVFIKPLLDRIKKDLKGANKDKATTHLNLKYGDKSLIRTAIDLGLFDIAQELADLNSIKVSEEDITHLTTNFAENEKVRNILRTIELQAQSPSTQFVTPNRSVQQNEGTDIKKSIDFLLTNNQLDITKLINSKDQVFSKAVIHHAWLSYNKKNNTEIFKNVSEGDKENLKIITDGAAENIKEIMKECYKTSEALPKQYLGLGLKLQKIGDEWKVMEGSMNSDKDLSIVRYMTEQCSTGGYSLSKITIGGKTFSINKDTTTKDLTDIRAELSLGTKVVVSITKGNNTASYEMNPTMIEQSIDGSKLQKFTEESIITKKDLEQFTEKSAVLSTDLSKNRQKE